MILRSLEISGILFPVSLLTNGVENVFTFSQKLQVDVGKVNEEKTLLSSIVKNTQGKRKNANLYFQNLISSFQFTEENKVLSKVMEKISSEYDELKKVNFET